MESAFILGHVLIEVIPDYINATELDIKKTLFFLVVPF